ncbi:hypothetical protein B0H13DRAFT_2345690 [Mycena leptocephala]|nr:hypothetical protein B0H13DRAFT_2345690 [Mycena leptocephala]
MEKADSEIIMLEEERLRTGTDIHWDVESRRLTTPLPALPLSVIPPPNLRPGSLLNDILVLNLNALLSRSKHGVCRCAYYQQALGNSGIHTAHHPCDGRINIPLRTVEQEARTGKSPLLPVLQTLNTLGGPRLPAEGCCMGEKCSRLHYFCILFGSAEPPSKLLEIVRDSSSLVAIQHCPTRSVQRYAPSCASGQFRAVHGRLKEYPASEGNGNSNGDGLHLYDGSAAIAPTRSTAITISTKSVPLLLFRRLTTISQYEPSTASPTWDSTAHWPIAHTHALAYHHQHQEPSMTSPTGTLPRTGPSRTHTRWRITRTTAAVAHLQSYLSCADASAHSAHALRTPHGAPPLAAPAAPSSPRMTHSPPTGRRSACSTPNRLPPSTYPPWLPLMLALGLYAPPARSGAPGPAGRKKFPIAVIPVVQVPAVPVRGRAGALAVRLARLPASAHPQTPYEQQ